MRTRRVELLVTILAILAAAGCESPQSRIEDNQAIFDTYPPESQALIRAGQIAIGFDRAQVEMALGRPDRQSGGGTVEEWLWLRTETRTIEVEKDIRQYKDERDEYEDQLKKGKGDKDLTEPSLTYPVRQQRTRVLRVIHFENGRVASWEEPTETYLDDWASVS